MSDLNLKALLAELERDEGSVAYAYPDSLGYLTIGVGHLIDKRKGGSIPPEIVAALLSYDVNEKIGQLNAAFPWWYDLDDVRRRVLVNMAFNLGIEGLAEFKNTLAAIQAGQWSTAAAGMRSSLWARQVGARAERLAIAIETGVMP